MSFLKLKNYTEKISVRLLFSKVFLQETSIGNCLFYPLTSVQLKIFFYTFIKFLKISKLKSIFFGLSYYSYYGEKLQNNGFYMSLIETKKKEKLKILNNKVVRVKSFFFVKESFQKFFLLDSLVKKKKTAKNLSKGLEKFEKYFIVSPKTITNRQVVLGLLKSKIFINKIFVSRMFLLIAKGRKKYRSSFSYLFRRRRKIGSLFHIFTSTFSKFKEIKLQRRKNMKKLAWKIKKQKKWKWARVGSWSWNLFRLRLRLSQLFYIPKHFEINYKTFGANYLGFTDFKTINNRIPFWLNLRRLLTFLS